MNEQRFVVTDVLWQRLEPHLAGKGQRCRSHGKGQSPVSGSGLLAGSHRVAMARPAACLRQLEQPVPAFPAVGRRSGVFESLFKAMSGDPDLEYALIDGTIVQVHQKATGAKGGLRLRPSGARAAG